MNKACSVCGCTRMRACMDKDGKPCFWVEKDLCSSCASIPFAQPPDPPFWCPKHNLKYGPEPKQCPTCIACIHNMVAYTGFKRCTKCGREVKTRKENYDAASN